MSVSSREAQAGTGRPTQEPGTPTIAKEKGRDSEYSFMCATINMNTLYCRGGASGPAKRITCDVSVVEVESLL